MDATAGALVVPGDLLDDSGEVQAGANTYKEGRHVYAQRLGLKRVSAGTVEVVALSGRYDPNKGDLIIGRVVECGPSNWYLDVRAPTDVGMHVNEVPWRVDFGETAKFLAVGDTVLLKVYHVDELRKAQVTMKDKACRKLAGGVTVEVSPSKVPRVIGREGAMVQILKARTRSRMFVGRNGVIWLDGEPEDVGRAVSAIRLIEAEGHAAGLAERVTAHLDALGAPLAPEGGVEADELERSMYEAPREEPRERAWGERPERGGRERGRGRDERGGRGGDRGRGRERGRFEERGRPERRHERPERAPEGYRERPPERAPPEHGERPSGRDEPRGDTRAERPRGDFRRREDADPGVRRVPRGDTRPEGEGRGDFRRRREDEGQGPGPGARDARATRGQGEGAGPDDERRGGGGRRRRRGRGGRGGGGGGGEQSGGEGRRGDW